MSYEGYEQVLCEKGHLSTFDCYDSPSADSTCMAKDGLENPVCRAAFVWSNQVDDTNGDACGYIDMETFKISDDIKTICSHCDHTKHVSAATYSIPPSIVS